MKNERLNEIRKSFKKYFGDTEYSELPEELVIDKVEDIDPIPQVGGVWCGNYKLCFENWIFSDWLSYNNLSLSLERCINGYRNITYVKQQQILDKVNFVLILLIRIKLKVKKKFSTI